MTLYSITLWVHSYLRWAIVLAALAFIVMTAGGWKNARAWSPREERLHAALLGMVDLQFMLGLLLYLWLSPITSAFFAAPKLGMRDSVLRFFGVEHLTAMFIAVAVLHIGRKRSKKATSDALRHRRAFTSALVFLLLGAAAIPWPGTRHGRPLFRTAGASEIEPAEASARAASQATCGEAYVSRCATCHGERGRGNGVAGQFLNPLPRDFADPAFQSSRSDAQISAVIRDGGAAHALSATMPPFPNLSENELKELTACVRSFGQRP
ncbi:MAG: c-type cytochrome [Myxococcota bacterium]